MSKKAFLVLVACLVVPVASRAEPRPVSDLLRLLQKGVGSEVVQAWIEQVELAAPPTADELIELKTAGATDELLVDLVRRARQQVRTTHGVRSLERVDPRTGTRTIEVTNRGADGSYPPAPPVAAPAPRRSRVRPEPDPEESWAGQEAGDEAAPPMIAGPAAPPVVIVAPPPAAAPEVVDAGPPQVTTRLHIIPARGPRAYSSANPPGHHQRYFDQDGYHFPHFPEDQVYPPLFYDYNVYVPPFWPSYPLVTGPPVRDEQAEPAPPPQAQPPAEAPGQHPRRRPHGHVQFRRSRSQSRP